MLEFQRWKVALVMLVCAFFSFATLPNLLPESVNAKLPAFLPSSKVPLGLDLRGGSYLLLQLDFNNYLREHMQGVRDNLREQLRKNHVGYTDLRSTNDAVQLRIRPETLTAETNLKKIFRSVDPDLTAEDAASGVTTLNYDKRTLTQLQSRLLDQSIEIVNRRVNEAGTKEPVIQRQGTDRIIVQVPGLKDPTELKHLLGKTARMTFHLVNESANETETLSGIAPPGTILLPPDDAEIAHNPAMAKMRYPVFAEVALSGDLLTGANVSYNNGLPVVDFQFNTLGAQKFGEITQNNINRRFAVVLDNKVITAPVIRSAILGGRGIIEGNFTVESANELALLLRAGALPAPLNIVEERSVGPSLGEDSVRSGTASAVLGIGLVVVFMFLAYGLFGLFANAGLLVHLIIVLGAMSLIGATMTLPGIAGIVLTMGMAVDANVLIFERMRDEVRFGKSAMAAMESGFRLAYSTIIDSNITTLIAAALLYNFGSGSVRGFAVTLTLGILSTMFASVMFTRMLIVFWIKRTKPKKVPI